MEHYRRETDLVEYKFDCDLYFTDDHFFLWCVPYNAGYPPDCSLCPVFSLARHECSGEAGAQLSPGHVFRVLRLKPHSRRTGAPEVAAESIDLPF